LKSKIGNYLILIVFCGLMIFATFQMPNRHDATSPNNIETSAAGTVSAANYYTKNAAKDAMTVNMVTVILADYRGYDTLGEETVIFTAGLICFLLLRRRRED